MAEPTTQTLSLIEEVRRVINKPESESSESVDVSKTVSFFALAYERFRNVIEFKDEHIIRRNAINRIISRRLAFNPEMTDEGLSLAKEIAWAGYYKRDKIPEPTIDELQRILTWHTQLRNALVKGEPHNRALLYAEFIKDLLVCQVEELFSGREKKVDSIFLFYFYQILNPQIVIEDKSEDEKNLLFYIALEQVFLKSDKVYLRFHLFRLLFEHLFKIKPAEFKEHLPSYRKAIAFTDKQIEIPPSRKVLKYLRNLRPSYLVLKELVLENLKNADQIIGDSSRLESLIEDICREKYQISKEKLSRAGVRSIIYIFLTKVIFVLIAEYPIMVQLGEQVDYLSLAINSLFPPFLMTLFVIMATVPDEGNTQKIRDRIYTLLYPQNVDKIVFRIKKSKDRSAIFNFVFWSFYFSTFGVTFLVINSFLNLLSFPLTSKVIFFFFITAVSFFGYRITQISKEYVVKEKESVLTPVIDFFMMPLVSVGKWLSSEISKINVLLFVFDFLIEAPFKVLFEVIEEWISFIRKRKEDII